MALAAHSHQFKELARHIRSIGDEPIVFIPSPGNWGDSLINAGTREFLRDFEIPYMERKRTEAHDVRNLKFKHILIGGGGGWCRFWHSTPEYVMAILPKAMHVTVLPTSIGDAPKQPTPVDSLSIFSRGTTGLECAKYNLKYCHDMAFYCTDGLQYHRNGIGHLKVMRVDDEGTAGEVPKDNYDLSLNGNGYADPRPFYQEIARFDSVFTDRLHVGIAAAQLGLRTTLHPSSYNKVQSVYEHSMRGVFENVRPMF